MKITLIVILTVALLGVATCSYKSDHSTELAKNMVSATLTLPQPPTAGPQQARGTGGGGGNIEAYVTPAKAEAASIPPVPTDRKIIRNGELTLELDSPTDAERKITAIAESLGGFVVTSESKISEIAQSPKSTINIIIRVPSAQFTAAIEKILGVGGRVLHKVTKGQDVTEEFIDLEARIRTKKALEAQFLEIMKQAHKVSDALEVQEKLADVRTQIEQLEGRRRFLENQSSLSTINVTLQPPAPVVTASQSSFVASVRQAFGDGVDLAAEIVLGLIRLFIIAIPIVALIVLPAWLVWRVVRRRFGWVRRPATQLPAAD